MVVAARYAPASMPRAFTKDVPRPIWLFLLALIYNTVVFILAFMLPETGIIAPIALLPPLLLLEGGTVWIVVRWAGGVARWDQRRRLAWIAGLLAFFIAFGVLADIDEQWTGKSVVGLVSILLLWRLWRRAG